MPRRQPVYQGPQKQRSYMSLHIGKVVLYVSLIFTEIVSCGGGYAHPSADSTPIQQRFN